MIVAKILITLDVYTSTAGDTVLTCSVCVFVTILGPMSGACIKWDTTF